MVVFSVNVELAVAASDVSVESADWAADAAETAASYSLVAVAFSLVSVANRATAVSAVSWAVVKLSCAVVLSVTAVLYSEIAVSFAVVLDVKDELAVAAFEVLVESADWAAASVKTAASYSLFAKLKSDRALWYNEYFSTSTISAASQVSLAKFLAEISAS